MLPGIPVVVFSNVDGVLDQPVEAPEAGAVTALGRLEGDAVPLVLCSSKTRAEIEAFQQALGIRHPFVCERGSAAFVPVGYFPFAIHGARDVAGYHAIELGRPYAEMTGALQRVAARQKIDLLTFGEMSVEAVAHECHQSLLHARLAKLREYSERFRLIDAGDSTRERLFRALESSHLRCFGGERYHDVGAAVDTRLAVSLLFELYKRHLGAVLSVGASEAAARFSYSRFGSARDVPHDGSVLVNWAAGLVDVVERLRSREPRLTS